MLSLELKKAIQHDKPIQWNGLTLFPIRTADYLEFGAAKYGLLVSQQTLPTQYALMNFLEALYAMDYDSRSENRQEPELFLRLILLLKMALKGPDEAEIFSIVKPENPRMLIAVKVRQNGVEAEITPRNFIELREILAAQNGLELPDENANPDLIRAENDIASAQKSISLKPDFEALLYAVAVKTGTPPEEIYGWTIRRFTLTVQAIERITGHLIAALTEAAGGKYRYGNPFPTWKYDRATYGLEDTGAMIDLSTLTSNLSNAVSML